MTLTPAERMAKARHDFEEAMSRGCSIANLRAARERDRHWAASARRADRESQPEISGRKGFVVIDEAAGFLDFETPWMMRD